MEVLLKLIFSVEAGFISLLNFVIAVLFAAHGGRFYFTLQKSAPPVSMYSPIAQKSLRMKNRVSCCYTRIGHADSFKNQNLFFFASTSLRTLPVGKLLDDLRATGDSVE